MIIYWQQNHSLIFIYVILVVKGDDVWSNVYVITFSIYIACGGRAFASIYHFTYFEHNFLMVIYVMPVAMEKMAMFG